MNEPTNSTTNHTYTWRLPVRCACRTCSSVLRSMHRCHRDMLVINSPTPSNNNFKDKTHVVRLKSLLRTYVYYGNTCSPQHAVVRTNRTVVFRDYHCKILSDLTTHLAGRVVARGCPQGHNTDVKKELNLSVHGTWNILSVELQAARGYGFL